MVVEESVFGQLSHTDRKAPVDHQAVGIVVCEDRLGDSRRLCLNVNAVAPVQHLDAFEDTTSALKVHGAARTSTPPIIRRPSACTVGVGVSAMRIILERG